MDTVRTKTLVLGLGNTLMGDEGIGVHVLEALEARLNGNSNVTLLDGGTLSFTLAGEFELADNLIVIDAANLQSPPGTVKYFEDEDMDAFLGTNKKLSVHEVSLFDLLAIAQLTESMPQKRALIGIQPKSIDWSEHPSEEVRRAIPKVCDIAQDIIHRWQL